MKKKLIIAVIGLGYVGLPLANAFARKYSVIGYDKNKNKIIQYKNGKDLTSELGNKLISTSKIFFTNNEEEIRNANVYIISVPTPIDENNNPFIEDTIEATKLVGRMIKKGDLIIYESTFYPGMTREKCVPILEKMSNMVQRDNFYIGYSPERINPGDKIHKLENIKKIVSGIDEKSKEYTYNLYKSILINDPYIVSSIETAEACKIIENTQRDVNIAFINEMSRFLKKMNINTNEVLKACSTKWNFINFKPGLVGGHCIGIDPYYLIDKSNKINEKLKIVEQSREVNEGMKKYIEETFLEKVEKASKIKKRKIIIYGMTFKENVSDTRNSKIIEIARDFENKSFSIYATDPYNKMKKVNKEYGTKFMELNENIDNVQGIIIGVAHDEYKKITENYLLKKLENSNCPIFDLYSIIKKNRNSKIWEL